MNYAMFFAEFESVNIGIKESESAFADNDDDVNAFFNAFNAFFTFYNTFQQFLTICQIIERKRSCVHDVDSSNLPVLRRSPLFHLNYMRPGSHQWSHHSDTICGPINGQITTILLNNAAAAHGITEIDSFEERKPREESHLFVFYSRYDSNIFQGIMPDTGAAGISTVGEPQVKALQLKFPGITMDLFIAGHKVKFGNNPKSTFLETVAVETSFGTIRFAVMPINTPFLLCLANMDRCGIYFNNINNCQTGLSILQARDRCDAHTEETRIPKINRTPQIATVADSHITAEKQNKERP
jgi:hypothetical protein